MRSHREKKESKADINPDSQNALEKGPSNFSALTDANRKLRDGLRMSCSTSLSGKNVKAACTTLNERSQTMTTSGQT
jgi:hypothetical protein